MKALFSCCRRLSGVVAVLIVIALALGAAGACAAGNDAPAAPVVVESGEADAGAPAVESGALDAPAPEAGPATVAARSEQRSGADEAAALAGAEDDLVAGMYAGSVAAGGAGGLDLVLDLAADGVAQLVTDHGDGGPVVVEIGSWQGYPDGSLTVVLATRIGHGEQAVPTTFVFQHAGDALVATEWDEQQFGTEAPRLLRQPAP